MKKIYLQYVRSLLFTSMFLLVSGMVYAGVQDSPGDTTNTSKPKITDTRKNKPAYLKNGVKVNFVPFKPQVDKVFGNTSTVPSTVKETDTNLDEGDKILNNGKVYPNPVTDQLNLTYLVSKDSNVIIMIMDVLGNEVATLFSERLPAGQQNHSFNIATKLSSGFYFVRLMVGNEVVIKRISVL